MLTPADVADLIPDDVVTVTGLNSTATGPLVAKSGGLYIAGYLLVRDSAGNPFPSIDTLTVVSRAPRPLFVNTQRDPLAGDVVCNADNHADTRTWYFDGTQWAQLGTGAAPGSGTPVSYRLLIDGLTGRFASQ